MILSLSVPEDTIFDLQLAAEPNFFIDSGPREWTFYKASSFQILYEIRCRERNPFIKSCPCKFVSKCLRNKFPMIKEVIKMKEKLHE